MAEFLMHLSSAGGLLPGPLFHLVSTYGRVSHGLVLCCCVAPRTIVSGMCWLATFVFGANALGLTLYGLQIALGLDKPAEQGTSTLPAISKDMDKEDKEDKPE